MRNNRNPIDAIMQSMYTHPDENPNHNLMLQLLQEQITFEGPDRNINQQNYYVVKHRLTKYADDIIDHEIRAGYMYVLVRRSNDVAVSYQYVSDGKDSSTCTGIQCWARWNHSDEGWIIYDGDDGYIRGNISGSMME